VSIKRSREMMRLSKSKAMRVVRMMFGPTTRIQTVEKAGLSGYKVVSNGKLIVQTFERLDGDWYPLIVMITPAWRAMRKKGDA
jgi:hypothetical protein